MRPLKWIVSDLLEVFSDAIFLIKSWSDCYHPISLQILAARKIFCEAPVSVFILYTVIFQTEILTLEFFLLNVVFETEFP